MKVFGDPEKIEEYGEPKPNAANIEGVAVVGYDPGIDKWLALEWEGNGHIWLVGGGKESDESYEQAAIRELKEESGYTQFKDQIQLGGPIISYYYNEKKASYRHSYALNYLFIIDSTKTGPQYLEEHERFTVTWLDYDYLYEAIKQTDGGIDHWLAVLRRSNAYLAQSK